MQRRDALKSMAGLAVSLAASPWSWAKETKKRPNVLIVFTDDQGWGDLGFHGNPQIQTPQLDNFARESTRLTQFYSQPVCTPSRACLMTGRYHYRTGAFDTYMGRAMLDPNEFTLAEMFSAAGYRTGIFGKWHLGDNYPLRAIDQGFQQALVHRGGAIGHFSDFPDNTYSDPVLQKNGIPTPYNGYCTDIFTNELIQFIEKKPTQPFFAYFASNIPHDPLEVPDRYAKSFRENGVSAENALVYGMLKNFDDNFGRILQKLRQLGIEDDTIILFMTDNGPAMQLSEHELRYNGKLRGEKKQVYEGGIRVPCFFRWPGVFEKDNDIDRIASLIDIMPTLQAACNLIGPIEDIYDGTNLMPLLTDKYNIWPDRILHFQWHRGNCPEKYRNSATRNQKFKLVNGVELYDLDNDPIESTNVATQYPKIVQHLRKAYEDWFEDMISSRGFEPPRIHLGSDHENPAVLNPTDWRNESREMESNNGYWTVYFEKSGKYQFKFEFSEALDNSELHFKINDLHLRKALSKGQKEYMLKTLSLPRGNARLEAFLTAPGHSEIGAQKVHVLRL